MLFGDGIIGCTAGFIATIAVLSVTLVPKVLQAFSQSAMTRGQPGVVVTGVNIDLASVLLPLLSAAFGGYLAAHLNRDEPVLAGAASAWPFVLLGLAALVSSRQPSLAFIVVPTVFALAASTTVGGLLYFAQRRRSNG